MLLKHQPKRKPRKAKAKSKLGFWEKLERRVCIGTIIFVLGLSAYAMIVAPSP